MGDAIRFNGTSWVLSLADSVTNADVDGLVVAVAGDDFTFAVPVQWLTIFVGLTPGDTYFLSPTVAGAVTASDPITVGQVSKPVLRAMSATAALFVGMRGVLIEPPP